MALFKCLPETKIKKDIELYLDTGWKNWSANDFWDIEQRFNSPIRPTKVELWAKVAIRNGGSGIHTWAGTNTIFYLKDTNGNWEEIAKIDITADYNVQTREKTQIFDISSITKGKKYVGMKIDVGRGSSDCTANRIGRATIKEYYR